MFENAHNQLGKTKKDVTVVGKMCLRMFGYVKKMSKKYRKVFKQNDIMLANDIFELAMLYDQELKFRRAIEHLNKALEIYIRIRDRAGEARCYRSLGIAYHSLGNSKKAIEFYLKSLEIDKEQGNRAGKAACYTNLGAAYDSLGNSKKAIEYHLKSLDIYKEIGDRGDEARCYTNLGIAYDSLCNFKKAIEYYLKSLEIDKEKGNRAGEAGCYTNLGVVYSSLGNSKKAIEYYLKSLEIHKEIGHRGGKAACYTNLGAVYDSLGNSKKAIEYHLKSLDIYKEIGDRAGEARCYTNLGVAYRSLGNSKKAIEYHLKSLEIDKERRDRAGETASYTNLGAAYHSLGNFKEAIEYHLKSLEIKKEIGDRAGEARCYTNLGVVYRSLGNSKEAIEYHLKSLEIKKEIGDRGGKAACYTNLGAAYDSLGNSKEAIEYHLKSLEIKKEIGDRAGEARCYTNLGVVYRSLGNSKEAIEYHLKSLEIHKEIGHRGGEAGCYTNLGVAYSSLGNSKKAIEYHLKSLEIHKEIGDRMGESIAYGNLGSVYYEKGKYQNSLDYTKQSLRIINLIREEMPYEELSKYYLMRRIDKYKIGVDAALKLYDENQHNQSYLLETLEIAERTKSRELVKQLRIVKKKEPTLEKEYEELDNLEYEIAALNLKDVKTEEDTKRLNSLYDQKAKLQEEIYHKSLDPATIIPSIDESIITHFWKKLGAYKDKVSVLEIYLHKDKILYFLFNETKYEIFTTAITDDLTKKTIEYSELEEVFKFSMKTKKTDLNRFYSMLRDLSVLLFPKELYDRLNNLGTENLFIIPHRWLHTIPFEALMIDNEPLSIKYNLSRHYSLDLLKFSLSYPEKSNDSALIISNPTGDLGDKEGIIVKKELSNYYKEDNIKFLSKEKATIDKVKNELCNASLIHFDCHGLFNLKEPLSSELQLKDQSLLASDIALMELNHHPLVYLNSCESGAASSRTKGKEDIDLDMIGDEQIGFVRAFNVAKTPTVIVTHWAVDIGVASKMAKYFYQELLEHKSTATQALKTARENVYGEYKDKSRDWSAYCLYGNPFKKINLRCTPVVGQIRLE